MMVYLTDEAAHDLESIGDYDGFPRLNRERHIPERLDFETERFGLRTSPITVCIVNTPLVRSPEWAGENWLYVVGPAMLNKPNDIHHCGGCKSRRPVYVG